MNTLPILFIILLIPFTSVFADNHNLVWNDDGTAYYITTQDGEQRFTYGCNDFIKYSCTGIKDVMSFDNAVYALLLFVVVLGVIAVIMIFGIKIKIPSLNIPKFNQRKQSYLLPHPKHCCEDCGIHHKHYCEIHKVECSLK